MHVVLSGYYGFDNVGDEAILFSIIHALRNAQPDINITVLSNNPEKTMQTYQVNSVNRRSLWAVRKVIKQSDGLISGGGSLLQDVTGPMSIPYYTGIIQLAKFYRKPVFIYAQGMGPINRKLSKWIVKVTLNKADGITVRDDNSRNLLKTIGVKSDARIAPDPVLGLDSSSFISSWLEEQKIETPIIAVSVRNWKEHRAYKERIAKCLDRLVQNGMTVIFVPMHGIHDYEASQDVASFMQEKSLISPHDATIEEKISLIGASTLLIGMRLHSLIFSALRITPFIAISYDPKIDSFAMICEQPVIGDVTAKSWDENHLFEKVQYSIEMAEEHTLGLERRLQSYKQEAMQTAAGALQLIREKVN
ncbi:polysaccharide pyruvyl transferase CsaB [Ornithinibacillus xuwenensis]|uniref:Polysaccharide pyruvyl transferase CsaB n=1 Tax=Ornithinibacillus xuwenensis TaxID=3144668 RepID=A0ABU9XGE1_9BACI